MICSKPGYAVALSELFLFRGEFYALQAARQWQDEMIFADGADFFLWLRNSGVFFRILQGVRLE